MRPSALALGLGGLVLVGGACSAHPAASASGGAAAGGRSESGGGGGARSGSDGGVAGGSGSGGAGPAGGSGSPAPADAGSDARPNGTGGTSVSVDAGADSAPSQDAIGAELRASVIWSAGPDQAVVFRRSFSADGPVAPARAHIFADARYSLWINGHCVSTGPSRFDPKSPEFDTVDVTSVLQPGTNVVAVLAYGNLNQISGQHMAHAGGMALRIEGSGLTVSTDSTWKASATTRFLAPTVTWSNFLESVDASREYDCLGAAFDDSTWPRAVTVNGQTWGPFAPRSIPLLTETMLTPSLPFSLPATTGTFDVRFDKAYVVAAELEFDAAAGTTVGIFGNTYKARQGRQVYRTIDTFGFGLDGTPSVRVTVTGTITLQRITFFNRVYPFEVRGEFHSSDPRLDKLWEISVRTIQQVSEDGYQDCPWERAEWMGDAAVVHYPLTRVALVGPGNAFGDPHLVRKLLWDIAMSQQTDGRLKAHAPSDRFDIHGYIEDYACLWIETVREYYEHTGDQAFVLSVWPQLTKQLALFASKRQTDGLVLGREFVIFDNPLVYQQREGATLNAFIYKALVDAAFLAGELGKATESASYQQQAAALAAAFDSLLWDGQAYRASTVDTFPDARRWYANLIALNRGVVPPSRLPGLRQLLLANAAPLSNTLFPYTHHWLFEELYKVDSDAADVAVLDRIRARWANTFAATNLDMTTDESFGPRNFHNFGSTAAYFLAASVLGVRMDGPVSMNRILLQPRLGDLTSANGTVMTEHGPVGVSWTRQGSGALAFSFVVPEGKTARVFLPAPAASPTVTLNGQAPSYATAGRFVTINLGAGSYSGQISP